MSEELMLYSYSASPLAVQKKPHTGDYEISVFGGAPATLRRGVDFEQITLIAALVETHASLGIADEVILGFFKLKHVHV